MIIDPACRIRVAVVTGASTGIGLAAAELLASRGHQLVIAARDAARLDEAAVQLRSHGLDVVAVAGDVAEPRVAERLMAVVMERHGHLDVLVNNAGGSHHSRRLSAIQDGDWEQTLRQNLTSAAVVCRAAVPLFERQARGAIVNVASLAGRQRSVVAASDYAAAKAGLIGFTRQLAHELGANGVRVNAVAPGLTVTERVFQRWRQLAEDERQRRLAAIPLGRPGTTREVAEAIAFLASDAASYITGATLDVNGGAYMG